MRHQTLLHALATAEAHHTPTPMMLQMLWVCVCVRVCVHVRVRVSVRRVRAQGGCVGMRAYRADARTRPRLWQGEAQARECALFEACLSLGVHKAAQFLC